MIGKKEMWDALASLRTEEMEEADTDYKNGYLDALTDMEMWLDGHWEEMA
ncbi:MAG: hypothetical protein IJX35_00360 [Candidatus Methanomethylophilaceae archaeon]|nr:hypothetical protein [Candidatus Methanomethylophilaceae archaeon]